MIQLRPSRPWFESAIPHRLFRQIAGSPVPAKGMKYEGENRRGPGGECLFRADDARATAGDTPSLPRELVPERKTVLPGQAACEKVVDGRDS
jgi:hypothetical protein